MPRQSGASGRSLCFTSLMSTSMPDRIHCVALRSPQCGSWCWPCSPCSSPPVPARAPTTGRGGWTTCAGSGPTTATTSGPIGRSRRRRGRLRPPAARRAALEARDPQPRARRLEHARLPVFHSLIIDTGSTCPTLEDCFRTVDRWSDAHPKAQTLILFVEGKVLPVNANPSVQGAVDAAAAEQGITNWDAAGFDRLDALCGGCSVPSSSSRTTSAGSAARSARRRTRRLADRRPREGQGDRDADRSARGARPVPQRAVARAPGDVRERKADGPRGGDHPRDVPDTKAGIPRSSGTTSSSRPGRRRHRPRAANDHTRADAALQSGAQIIVTDYPVPDPTIGPYSVSLNR